MNYEYWRKADEQKDHGKKELAFEAQTIQTALG